MCIIERIESLLKLQNKQAKDLCEHAHISQNTYSNWKRRGTEPNAKYIADIADFLNVSVRYLLTGEEDSDNYYLDPEVAVMAQEMATRPELKVLFKASRNVSKESIEAINNMIEKMTKD